MSYIRLLVVFMFFLVTNIESKEYGSEVIGKWCNAKTSNENQPWVQFNGNGDFIMGFGDWEENHGSWVIYGDYLEFSIAVSSDLVPITEDYSGVYRVSGDTLVMDMVLFHDKKLLKFNFICKKCE